ncbi:hypothetical protein [Elstera litoralis]|nr:hypothetical protein [Elstera litoralis]
MTKAENALETKEREYQLKMQSLANFDKEFSKVENQVNKELKEIAADRDSLLLEMKKGSNPRLENILKDMNTREDRIEARLTQMEERKASIPSVLEQLDAQRAEAREEFAAVKQQMTRLHPIWALEADFAQAREMSDQIRKTMADKKDATPLERGLMEASLEASQLMERLLSGNADQLKSMQKSFDEITANLQTEYARLTEVVTDKGVLSTVADEISSWF